MAAGQRQYREGTCRQKELMRDAVVIVLVAYSADEADLIILRIEGVDAQNTRDCGMTSVTTERDIAAKRRAIRKRRFDETRRNNQG